MLRVISLATGISLSWLLTTMLLKRVKEAALEAGKKVLQEKIDEKKKKLRTRFVKKLTTNSIK